MEILEVCKLTDLILPIHNNTVLWNKTRKVKGAEASSRFPCPNCFQQMREVVGTLDKSLFLLEGQCLI